jgi:hypothetical protein
MGNVGTYAQYTVALSLSGASDDLRRITYNQSVAGMRDNSEGFVELADAYEREGGYHGVVRVSVAGQFAALEFGISTEGYRALRRVFNARPFDTAPGLKYRYFFTGSYGRRKMGEETVLFQVRIEQGRSAKSFEFSGPTSLVANLRWFMELKTLDDASALKRVDTVV